MNSEVTLEQLRELYNGQGAAYAAYESSESTDGAVLDELSKAFCAASSRYDEAVHDYVRQLLTTPPATAREADGPDFGDGCDSEGFPGGCERMGHTVTSCPQTAREAVAWQYRICLQGRWHPWRDCPKDEYFDESPGAEAGMIEYRELYAHPAAGAVVVDEAAVSRLADFIEDRPAYICLPYDVRERIASEYLTAAIGGKP